MYKFTLSLNGNYYVSELLFLTEDGANGELDDVLAFLNSKCGIRASGFIHMA